MADNIDRRILNLVADKLIEEDGTVHTVIITLSGQHGGADVIIVGDTEDGMRRRKFTVDAPNSEPPERFSLLGLRDILTDWELPA